MGSTEKPIPAEQLLAQPPPDDIDDDICRTFNRIQGHTICGGVIGVGGDVWLNQALWTLTERMAGLKGAA